MIAVLLTPEEAALYPGRSRPTVVIGIEGGIIQGGSANGKGIDVIVLDYDEDEEEVSQSDGATKTAAVEYIFPEYDPDWVATL